MVVAIPGTLAVCYTYVEPWWYASRWYARDQATTKAAEVKEAEDARIEALRQSALQAVQRNYAATRDTQLELAEGKRDQAVENIAKWNLELAKAVKANDQTSQDMANRIINSLTTLRDKLNAQINTLTTAGSSR